MARPHRPFAPAHRRAAGCPLERLRDQLELIDELNATLAPFRILSGIEVDILDDGSLDQTDDLLGRLDVVVASVHSKLRMESGPMTRRMIAAVRNPHTDVLGHCTGRIITGRGRPQSEFDAEAVFTACRESGVAVEINCRPERQDPPDDLLRLAVEIGCLFAIDTDAHAPGQLDWLDGGCGRAEQFGIGPDRVINTRSIPVTRELIHPAGHEPFTSVSPAWNRMPRRVSVSSAAAPGAIPGRPKSAWLSASVASSASSRPAGVMLARTTRLSAGDTLRSTSPRCSSLPMALVTDAGCTIRRMPILPIGSEPARAEGEQPQRLVQGEGQPVGLEHVIDPREQELLHAHHGRDGGHVIGVLRPAGAPLPVGFRDGVEGQVVGHEANGT